jgi:hypothetical protein
MNIKEAKMTSLLLFMKIDYYYIRLLVKKNIICKALIKFITELLNLNIIIIYYESKVKKYQTIMFE